VSNDRRAASMHPPKMMEEMPFSIISFSSASSWFLYHLSASDIAPSAPVVEDRFRASLKIADK
jgi:hypothetical protein